MEEADGGKALITSSKADSSQAKTPAKDPLVSESFPSSASGTEDAKLVDHIRDVHLNETSLKTVSSNGTVDASFESVDNQAMLGSQDAMLEVEEAELDYEEDDGEIIDPVATRDGKGIIQEDGELEEGELEDEKEEGELEDEKEEGEILSGSEIKVKFHLIQCLVKNSFCCNNL